MEFFNREALIAFVKYARSNDMQITSNRREARALYLSALDFDGSFEFPIEKADKLLTFLSLNDAQVHGADAKDTVSIYAFIRILGDLSMRLRPPRSTPTPSGGASGSP